MKWLKSFWKTLSEAESESLAPLGNFTPRAQQVLALAGMEARGFNHHFVGTEHVLLGIVSLGQGTAVSVLQQIGVDLKTVRQHVQKQLGSGLGRMAPDATPYTPRVKKVLMLAEKEAKSLEQNYVGTEHILLGLLREGDGVGGRVLRDLGVNLSVARQCIMRELNASNNEEPPSGQDT
jgi:ATP-dependent Clp protease ATP-binding subunit ClpC